MNTTPFFPARQVLTEAMQTNQRLGHENLGFLSDTHGIMPVNTPMLSLPSDYHIWDEIASELPDLCRSLNVRKRLDNMPLLRANDTQKLPDTTLLRASAIISAFAHAYHYIDIEPPTAGLPPAIQQPWEDIARRLHRREAHMSYIDMSTYNWRLLDADCPDPMGVENLQLLVPIWGNEAERIFLASTIETQAKSTPLINGIVQAQEATVTDEPGKLEQALSDMIVCLNHLSQICVPKISPNRYSPFFVEPVTWAKTFAPLSVPIRKGAAGPVGAATASFQALDAFLERKKYEGGVAHESILVREWFPKHWRDFYEAAEKISVPEYIRNKSSPILSELFQEVLDAFAGKNGYLGRHRLKSYGYMETAFKCGRSSTAAFEGSFKSRAWDNIDDELKLAQQERYNNPDLTDHVHYAQVTKVSPVSQNQRVVRVDLAFDGKGVRYQAGDRCAILPENSDELVQKTLDALQASGDEPVYLDETWRVAIQYRQGHQGKSQLPLRLLLKFGQLRPLTRNVAQQLLKFSQNDTLQKILYKHTESEWELWDLLDILPALPLQTLFTTRSGTGSKICQIIPPESFRLYSISSASTQATSSRHLQLTIGIMTYTQQTRQLIRRGIASNFLASAPKGKITAKIIPSPYFRLPPDHHRPIVMFAAGTGISPFLSFIKARVASGAKGEIWLFLSVRTSQDFYYQPELTRLVADKQLKLTMVFTQEDIKAELIHDDTGIGKSFFRFVPASRYHIGEVIAQTDNASDLWELLRPGGQGAYLYVCGQTGFAMSVKYAIQDLFEHFAPSGQNKQPFALKRIEHLMAICRYCQETFTPFSQTITPKQTDGFFSISDIVLHNHEEQGYWLVIDDVVYDITAYGHEHPGGFKILRAYVGMDATPAYQRVGHHQNQEVQAMLAAYKIGVVRPLPYLQKTPDLQALYRQWVDYLYLLVEIENTLYNDFSFQDEAATSDETSKRISISPAKLMFHIKSHQRFLQELLPQLTGKALIQLWQLTAAPDMDENQSDLPTLLADSLQKPAMLAAAKLHDQLMDQLKQQLQTSTSCDILVLQELRAHCILLENENYGLLQQFKLIILSIVQRFERFSSKEKEYRLMTSADCNNISASLQSYYERLGKFSEKIRRF